LSELQALAAPPRTRRPEPRGMTGFIELHVPIIIDGLITVARFLLGC
jgi:hypothetical protein